MIRHILFVPPARPGESRCPGGRRRRGNRAPWPLPVTVIAVIGAVTPRRPLQPWQVVPRRVAGPAARASTARRAAVARSRNARLRDRRFWPGRPDPNRSALSTLARSQCWWSALVRACRYRTRASHVATANARRDPGVASSIQMSQGRKRPCCRAVVATPPPAPGSCPGGSQAIGQ